MSTATRSTDAARLNLGEVLEELVPVVVAVTLSCVDTRWLGAPQHCKALELLGGALTTKNGLGLQLGPPAFPTKATQLDANQSNIDERCEAH